MPDRLVCPTVRVITPRVRDNVACVADYIAIFSTSHLSRVDVHADFNLAYFSIVAFISSAATNRKFHAPCDAWLLKQTSCHWIGANAHDENGDNSEWNLIASRISETRKLTGKEDERYVQGW